MNTINERQNTQQMIDLLKLQKYNYSQVSKIEVVKYLVAVILPFLFSIICLFNISSTIKDILTLIGFLGIVICWFLERLVNNYKVCAAKVQYSFDLNVFDLNSNSLIQDVKIQDMLCQSKKEKIQKIHVNTPWYIVSNGLSGNEAILYCQEQNIRWDKNLRLLYRNVLLVLNVIFIFLILIFSLIFDFSIRYVILLVPIVLYSIIFIININENLKEQDKIRQYLDNVKGGKIKKDNVEKLEEYIYNYRISLIKIPDWFYELFQKGFHEDENNRKDL